MIDTSAFQGRTAAYYTLGCKLNFSETSTFGRLLEEMGVRTVSRGERADICLINTCSVTEVADHKCRQAIHRMVRENPGAMVVVTGCYAQLEGQTVSQIPGVDLVLGSNEKASLVQHLSEAWAAREEASIQGQPTDALHQWHGVKRSDIRAFQPSCSRGNRTRYFLKVQDGCDYYCTYCTIPMARGRSRNPTIASLVEQVEQAVREGGREVVLTGVNIGDFGRTTGERFLDLLRALDAVEGIDRYRISSIEPELLTDEIIDFCAHSRAFMPHFHIPLQSGSDEVLRLMRRHYDTQLFAHKVKRIKELIPHCFIGVDVMVGCRGERPEDFEACYNFIDQLPVTQLHVFPYSERPNTRALDIPLVVPEVEKKRRSKRLLALSEEKRLAFYRSHMGQQAKVLLEKNQRGKAMHGFTENYIRVELPASEANAALDNQIVTMQLGELTPDGNALRATVVETGDAVHNAPSL